MECLKDKSGVQDSIVVFRECTEIGAPQYLYSAFLKGPATLTSM
jgi:hypothetical protein